MNTNINLEGVTLSRQQAAEKEIAEYLDIFSRSLSTDILISKIIVAADFEGTVNQMWSAGKEHGLKYSAKHDTGRAIGKTLNAITNNEISHIVIMDGTYIGNWEDNEKATRFELFLHEFIHAYLNSNRFRTMGTDGLNNDFLTIEGVCFQLALTRDEYIVDSYLDVLCKKFLTGGDKQPLSLHRLNLARGIDYLDTYINILDKFPVTVKENTAAFKNHEKSMNDVWNILSSYIEELLTVFAHLAGSREKEADWDSIKKKMSGTEAHKKYLSGRIKAIYTEWVNYFLENYDEVKSLNIIRDEIQGIFQNCGLGFKNVADGIYMTITDTEN
jgi:hypothetical protein